LCPQKHVGFYFCQENVPQAEADEYYEDEDECENVDEN
jgi:hypothetical protein